MREILFRGKRVDGSEWSEGFYVEKTDSLYGFQSCYIVKQEVLRGGTIDELTTWYRVDPETVGQYTGLTDKNGKRIFEEDIVIFKTTNYHFEPCVVEYRNDAAQFVVSKNGRRYPMADDFSYEIIGNIHDNPEMIGGKEDGT